jgi:hypothetical protein
MPPLLALLFEWLWSIDGAIEEPEPGGHAVLLLLMLDLLFSAVLPTVEFGVVALPLALVQSLSRLEPPPIAPLPELPVL